MAGLTFTKKNTAKKTAAADTDNDAPFDTGKQTSSKTTKQVEAEATSNKPKPKASGLTFLKRGQAAKEMIEQEEVKQEARKAEYGKLYRFWMKEGDAARITFLDGSINDQNMLDCVVTHEHRVVVNGDAMNYVCTSEFDESQPCPLCEKGNKSSMVAALTILDHREHKIKSGPNKGKTVKNTKKLFVFKGTTLQKLTVIAQKRGGLTGCMFDVTRTGDNSASVGSDFDFEKKFKTRAEIMEAFDIDEEDADDVMPADYEAEFSAKTPEELISLGIAKAPSGPGYSKGGGKSTLQDEL